MGNIVPALLKLGWSIIADPKNNHFELVLSQDTTFVMWDRPGAWCSDEELQNLLIDLKTVIQNSKDKDVPEYGVLLGSREDMKTRLISIIYLRGKPVGFSAQAHINFRIGLKHIHVIHLGLVYVDATVRGGGMTGILYALPNLLLLLKSGLRSHWVSNVTQVPAIFGLVEDFYSDAYPNSQGTTQSFEHYVIANSIIKDHRHVFGVGTDCDYDAEKQIIRNAYTGGSDNLKKSYNESSKSRNEVVNQLCKDSLDYVRGDDYLQLAVLDYRLLFKFIGSKAVKSKFGFTILNVSFLFATSLVVPLARWIVPAEEPRV